MIEVFKTNVQDADQASMVVDLLQKYFPSCRINFDLHDCDKILRIEGDDFENEKVIALLNGNGFNCSVLE